MKKYTKNLDEVKEFLRSRGWKVIKDPESGNKDFCAQGVIYMNFCKEGMGIHLEYGDEGCVFDEIDE